MRRRLSLCLAVALALACDEPPAPAEVAPAPPPPARREVAAPRAVATGAAFDLVIDGSEPRLVWAEPSAIGGTLQTLALTRLGAPAGAPRAILEPDEHVDILELSVAGGAGQLVLAWVERLDTLISVHATFGDAAGAFAPPRRLGATTRERFGSRGHVAAAASDAGHLEVMARLAPQPCVEPTEEVEERPARPRRGKRGRAAPRPPRPSCVPIVMTRLAPGPTERQGVGLALPRACEPTVMGFVRGQDAWYYGVCDATEGPATTVYAIARDPDYAHAERVLADCAPRGLTRVAGGVIASAECDGVPRHVRFSEGGRASTPLEGEASIRCEEGRATLILPGGSDEALDAPRDRLEALLSASVAPRNSRAVWTGAALLVAHHLEREVALRRYECDGETLRRTDRE